jgi:hypothetical protein
MFTEQIKSNGWEIVEELKGQFVKFLANGKKFVVSQEGDRFSVYAACDRGYGNNWQLLPGFKSGKSFETISNFVNARI